MKAKKSLGQNWLVDEVALQKIIDAAELSETDNVLEIGPGTGVLTTELLKGAGRMIAIEKDRCLAEEVARNFQFEILNLPAGRQGFQSISNDSIYKFENKEGVVSGDILGINLPKLLEENDFTNYKLVANIPYYITGKLLRLIFETKHQPKLIVLLVQKEVAERVCAGAGEMSKLSVMIQLHAKPEIVADVPAESFDPVPKVDSAILKITPLGKKENKELMRLVRVGFASRRKTLVNNLSSGLQKSKEEIEKALSEIGKDSKIRAQDLSVEDWENLSKLLKFKFF